MWPFKKKKKETIRENIKTTRKVVFLQSAEKLTSVKFYTQDDANSVGVIDVWVDNDVAAEIFSRFYGFLGAKVNTVELSQESSLKLKPLKPTIVLEIEWSEW